MNLIIFSINALNFLMKTPKFMFLTMLPERNEYKYWKTELCEESMTIMILFQ